MMILCSFSPCPDDALLARGATYQKKNLSITLSLRREIVGLTYTDYVGNTRSRQAATCSPLALER